MTPNFRSYTVRNLSDIEVRLMRAPLKETSQISTALGPVPISFCKTVSGAELYFQRVRLRRFI